MVNDDKQFSWQPLLKKDITFSVTRDDTTAFRQFELSEEYDGYSIGLSSHIFVEDKESGARWAASPYQGEKEDGSKYLGFDIDEDNIYLDGNFEGDYSTLKNENIVMCISGGSETTEIERAADGTIYFVNENGVSKLVNDSTVTSLGLDTLQVNDLFLDNNDLWAATNHGLYFSESASGTWQKSTPVLSDGLGVEESDFQVSSILKAPTGEFFLGNTFGGVLKGDGSDFSTANIGLINRGSSLDDIDKVMTSFNDSSASDNTKGIYEVTTAYFGQPANVDGQDKVFILLTDLIDQYFMQAGNGIDYVYSRFDSTDQKLKTENANSNQRDILYLDNYPVQISKEVDEAESSLSHALTQMIIYNYDPDETDWLAEGLAMWSRWINGYKFYNNPDEAGYLDLTSLKPKDRNNLLIWGDSDNWQREREGSFVFFVFIFEKYLKTQAKVMELVKDTDNGLTSLLKYVDGKTFTEIYIDFSMTLYLDQLGHKYKSGKYALDNIDLEYRVLPLSWGFLPNTEPPYPYVFAGNSWYYYSAEFYSETAGMNKAPLLDSVFVFNGDDNTEFFVYIIEQTTVKFDTATFTEDDLRITKLELNEYNVGHFVPDAKRSETSSGKYEKLNVMVVSNEPVGAFKMLLT